MLNDKQKTITKEIDVSFLNEDFYIAILNKILELKKQKDLKNNNES